MLHYLYNHGLQLYEGYLWTLTFADKRVADWPMMSSPIYTAYLTLSYLLMLYSGPKLMAAYEPLNIQFVLIFYNSFMVLLNAYTFTELLYCSYMANYNYTCQPVDYSNNVYEVRIAKALWWFYISKAIEFLDTLFFILRKKDSQITFLHVYHHSTMFCFWWIGIKWVAGGSAFLVAMLNSLVHTCMYLYYALSAASPSLVSIHWKKALTVLQLTQFFIAIVQGIRNLNVNCPFPKWMHYTLVGYMVSFILLFLNFWINSYGMPKKLRSLDIMKINGICKPYLESNGNCVGSNGTSDNMHSNGTHHISNGVPKNDTVPKDALMNGIHLTKATSRNGQQRYEMRPRKPKTM